MVNARKRVDHSEKSQTPVIDINSRKASLLKNDGFFPRRASLLKELISCVDKSEVPLSRQTLPKGLTGFLRLKPALGGLRAGQSRPPVEFIYAYQSRRVFGVKSSGYIDGVAADDLESLRF